MKALVLEQYRQLVYRDVPDPEPGPDEVLIRVKACGICGSDAHGWDGSTGRRIPPIIMGHEAAGVIVGRGKEVAGWSVGDRVTFDSTIYCGKCRYCAEGRINLCDQRRVLGVSCAEYRRDGALADYVAMPQRVLYRLPDSVSFVQAAMTEPMSVAFHAAGRAAFDRGDTAVVVGAGVIGLLIVQRLRMSGCGTVIALDIDPWRLEMARRLGADLALHSTMKEALPAVLERTGGRGAHLSFDAVGIDASMEIALGSLRKGGSLVLVGNVAPSVSLPLQAVVTRQISLLGSCASSGEYADCLEAIGRGQIQTEEMISATAPLREGGEWFERLNRREAGLMKVILVPEE
jgi:L-iditol 2-dehydrogenase